MKRSLQIAVPVLLLMAMATAWLSYRGMMRPHIEGFSNEAGAWTPYGGAWQLSDGVMRNNSDERGAKLLGGSKYWKDYSVEADVALLGSYGDTGLIVRARDPEQGVDSYSGFFAGLRTLDNTLILGRSDFGWEEYKATPIPGNIQVRRFYHLKVVVVGCSIGVRVDLPDGSAVREGVELSNCVGAGQVGVKSYQTPAMWKNFSVKPATRADLRALMDGVALGSHKAGTLHGVAQGVNDIGPIQQEALNHRLEGTTVPVAELRLLSPTTASEASIRGVVRLLSPIVYVEDATGGIAVESHDAPALAIGDEVQITGVISRSAGMPVMRQGHVKILWSNNPASPPMVTADEAATGDEDGRLVVLQGTLMRTLKTSATQSVLELEAGGEVFRAIPEANTYQGELAQLKPGSELQLTGVIRSDPLFAGDSAFALLLSPSQGALRVTREAPWWTPAHIVFVAVLIVAIVVGGVVIYNEIKHRYLLHVLEERELLAHDLHDTVSQSFAGIGFQLRAVEDTLGSGKSPRLQLERAQGMVRESHEELRRSITTLRSEVASLSNLAAALKACAERLVEGGSLAIECVSEGEPRRLPLRVADCFFRIGQESISNAVLHAEASSLSIRLRYEARHLTLVIIDNGRGLSEKKESTGNGLFGMNKRAEMIGAHLQISSDDHGTTVQLETELVRLPHLLNGSGIHGFWPYLKASIWKGGRHD